ncbi:MerR family transcriptional regulator [Psychrilyobacter atlanticus]|uniref:MerR family transcriptional regulator n=1 Tax=Psychrilyobacter atlanticus TaxID=271091 RepID=UPI0004265796|nr:MerR family transcriptional regulator [Psychrilyobacter atlanticus]
MTIDEVAKHFRISKSKLRYYEKNGVIKEIARDNNGNRVYTDSDLVWIDFFLNLKDTGMSLKEIVYYIGLKKDGEKTVVERKEILLNHVDIIQEKIEELNLIKKEVLEQVKRYENEEGNCIIKSKIYDEEKC